VWEGVTPDAMLALPKIAWQQTLDRVRRRIGR
jgi:hypothetical protein